MSYQLSTFRFPYYMGVRVVLENYKVILPSSLV